MLSVAIHLYRHIIAVGTGIAVTALHAAADAQIHRQVQMGIMMAFQQLGGAVGGTVVDDKEIHLGTGGAQPLHRVHNGCLLVVAGDNHKNFCRRIQEHTSHQGTALTRFRPE